MEKYVFLFERQRLQYLMKSVAIALGSVLLTMGMAFMLYLIIKPEEHHFIPSMAFFLFFIPAIVAHYRQYLCRKMHFICFFLLLIVTISLPLVWVIAKTNLSFIVWSLVAANIYFAFTVYYGLKTQKTLSFSSITFLMFCCAGLVSLFEAFSSLFRNQSPSMYWTLVVAAIIFGLFNIHDVVQFKLKLSLQTGYEQKDVTKTVNETALSLYLNFIGMIMIVDFVKFVIKLLIESPIKKSVST